MKSGRRVYPRGRFFSRPDNNRDSFKNDNTISLMPLGLALIHPQEIPWNSALRLLRVYSDYGLILSAIRDFSAYTIAINTGYKTNSVSLLCSVEASLRTLACFLSLPLLSFQTVNSPLMFRNQTKAAGKRITGIAISIATINSVCVILLSPCSAFLIAIYRACFVLLLFLYPSLISIKSLPSCQQS